MTKKRRARFNSLSTPGRKQDLSNYLVELAFLRQNRGAKLPAKFWQLSRYKWRYRKEIQACRKHIKKYGESLILRLALDNHIRSWTDYGHIEFLAQKLNERKENRAKPKDTSQTSTDFSPTKEDNRSYVVKSKPKRGVFDRLKELNG